MKCLLVCMPFGDLRRPALGLSTLKGSLLREGMQCDVAYLNLAYARVVGEDVYRCIAEHLPLLALAGEWIFAEALRRDGRSDWRSYEQQVLCRFMHVSPDLADVLRFARDRVRPFLDEALSALPWAEYDVVGFTSFGAQNAGSLALGRLVKERDPDVVLAFGGHNWWGSAGEAFHRLFPWVDLAFTGESDVAFVDVLKALGVGREPKGISGVVLRGHGLKDRALPARPILHLDDLPFPEHDDYFTWLRRTQVRLDGPPVVPVELSRGCWWAAKGPCSFCSINGERRAYRAKSAGRMTGDMLAAATIGEGHVDIVDNVVPRRFLDHVLPGLTGDARLSGLSFKIRPDVSHRDVKKAAAAGASVTCGIESLSGRLLGSLRKGVSEEDVITLLRWCAAEGLPVRWNLLWGLPGERPADYEVQLRAVEGLLACSPPETITPILLERHSLLWREADERGFRGVKPSRAYTHVYPLGGRDLAEVAYFFEHDYRPGLRTLLEIRRLAAGVERWRTHHGTTRPAEPAASAR